MNRVEIPSMLFGLPDMLRIGADNVCGYVARSPSASHLQSLRTLMKSRAIRRMAYSGVLTLHAKRRLSKCAQILACVTPNRWMVHPVSQNKFEFRIAFVTLTLPVDLSPDQEKNSSSLLIKPFIQALVRRFGVKNYVWRIERTESGRLHWHFVIDQPIHYQHLQNVWNRLLRQNRLLDDYAKEHGHYNAPSTDIRKVRDLKKALKYVSKYVSKQKAASPKLASKLFNRVVDQLSDLTESELNSLYSAYPQFKPIPGRLWDASIWLKRQRWQLIEVGKEFWAELLHEVQSFFRPTGIVPGAPDTKCFFDQFFMVFDRELMAQISDYGKWFKDQFSDWIMALRVDSGWLQSALVPSPALPQSADLVPDPMPELKYIQSRLAI